MNIYNVNDKDFQESKLYQDFLKENPKEGYLKIRASTAFQAFPIPNLKIEVSITRDNNKIIFFEGYTNPSGIIERITLPAPITNPNDLVAPASTKYDILATYQAENFEKQYTVNIYENIYVLQTINVIPNISLGYGDL